MNLLYRKGRPTGPQGPVHYSQVKRNVPLGGDRGPLAAILSRSTPGQTWAMGEREMLATVMPHHTDIEGWQHSEAFSFVIDLKPGADHLNLYELKQAWGMVTQDRRGNLWSPIALELRTLFRDGESLPPEKVAHEKSEFDDSETREEVLEFLYQVRTDNGLWKWSTPGSVNGCLLFPEHMRELWTRIHKEFGQFVRSEG